MSADLRPAPDEPLVQTVDLHRHYAPRRRSGTVIRAVDGVSIGIGAGETLGVVGESGCGKSTLARILIGLDRPTSGQVLFEGTDVATLSRAGRKQLRREVQLVMQDPYTSLDPRMTAEQILAEPFDIHRDARRSVNVAERVRELLEMVGLNPDHARRYPHEFSGGQRQRIGIARALALRPRVVVCDEPVSALDVSIQAQVINLLAELQQQFGLSYVFIAHDLSVVRQVADRIAVMYLGRIVEDGTCDEVFADPEHPYTQALLSAAPVPDPLVQRQRRRIMLSTDLPGPGDLGVGCRFRTRCPRAESICSTDDPALLPAGLTLPGAQTHRAACHFARRPHTATAQGA